MISLSQLIPHLLYTFKSEAELVSSIEELSHNFTKDRSSLSDYLDNPRLVSAYVAFYFTTNAPKLEAIMEWMPRAWKDDLKLCDLIDVGAGPGTFSLAWSHWNENPQSKIYQIENSKPMLEQARKIWQGLYPQTELFQTDRWNFENNPDRLMLFGHSANEMGTQQVTSCIEKAAPEHVLFIEPGTKSFFPEMLKIRQWLLSSGYQVLFPCPLELDCPMKGDSQDWCHQFIRVSHSPDVERLTQLVKKDRKLLPLIVHAYSKKSYPKETQERVVRVLPETKFSYEWDVCHSNHLEHYQVMKRSLDKIEQKSLAQVLAGAKVETTIEKEVEKTKRVKVLGIK